MILRMHLIPLFHQVTELYEETNLSGLAMGCRQPSKSDQVPDLNEKANLTQKSQVPELKELYLVEGKRQFQNEGDYCGNNHIKVLSNMMEEEDTCC